MNNSKIISLILLLSIFIFSCSTIPKIQNGNDVQSISASKVTLENGNSLKMFSKKTGIPTTIILVRHAEKMKNQKDPNLTKEGKVRAKKLQKILSTLEIDYVFSTKYNRTIQTAQPTAEAKSLAVGDYNPRALNAFGKMVLENFDGKKVLVVGHSNTTPNLLNYFMDEEVVASIDESDYTNLFVVNVFPNGDTKAILLKF